MDKKAVNYFWRLMAQRALGLLCYLLGARWRMDTRSIIYFAAYFGVAMLSCGVMFRVDQETLARRGDIKTDSPKWDKLLLGAYWILGYFIVYLVAGLTVGESKAPDVLFWTGLVLQLLTAGLALWALTVNTFLESTARLQKDRKQTVCQSGPYSVVRHPTYSSVILWSVSLPMVFGSWAVAAVCAVCAAVIIVRTALEDKMLMSGLDGYPEYAAKVKYRLVPFVW